MSRPALKMSVRESVRTTAWTAAIPVKSATVRKSAPGPAPAAMSLTARRQSHGTLIARLVAAIRHTTPAPRRRR
jgi:hypothetical protein